MRPGRAIDSLPRGADRPPRAGDQLRGPQPRLRPLAGCPEWARKTLAAHAGDRRPVLYTAAQLEAGETHDPLWNAAQKEMVLTGRMHNYLRMYWAKKILEWTPDAETAFDDRARPERPLRDGRPRPQRLHGRGLGDRRQARPPLARAADLRHRAVHELREHAEEVRLGGVYRVGERTLEVKGLQVISCPLPCRPKYIHLSPRLRRRRVIAACRPGE